MRIFGTRIFLGCIVYEACSRPLYYHENDITHIYATVVNTLANTCIKVHGNVMGNIKYE